MKAKSLTILLVMLLPVVACSQFEAVHAYGSYSFAMSKRLAVSKATAFGGGVELRYKVEDMFFISLGVGFERYSSIQQDSALARWNWRFWNERYAGNVRQMLSTTRGLAGSLEPVQYMEVLPMSLSSGVCFEISEDFSIRQGFGGGVLFYARSLYMDENWSRRFDELNHTFEYSFRNFAQDKKGNPFFLAVQTDIAYRLTELVSLDASARYTGIIRSKGKFGYEDFLFNDALSVRLGISFLY